MRNSEFRALLATSLSNYNAFFGDNVGDYGDYAYKVNYQIVSNTILGGQRTYVLDIDVYSNDEVVVEQKADEIEYLFDCKSKQHNNSWCTFFLGNRYNNDDKNTYRRTLSYEVRTYKETY